MKKFIIILVVVIAIIATVFMINKSKGKEVMATMNKVRSIDVKRGNITIKMEETGEIKPVKKIELKTQVGGKLIRFYVAEGDYIRKGDIIADVEPDYDQSSRISGIKSSLKTAEIRFKKAKKRVADNENLFAKKFISKEAYDDSKDELEKAQIAYNIAVQQQELIKDIDTDGNISKIHATASGTIISRLVEEGEIIRSGVGSVAAGTVILKLADLSKMIVNSSINEVDISKISRGQKVKIQLDAYPYESFEGEITKISEEAINSNNVKVFPVEITIAKSDRRLKPGMTANVTIIGETRDSILVVPIRTIFADDLGNDIVYKVVNDSISGKVVVKTGINDMQKVEIIDGLKDGDKVSLSEPIKTNMSKKIRMNF